jgi:N-methylhydantoinase B/oxoprolinase/acetone carboxylase alpha subunit
VKVTDDQANMLVRHFNVDGLEFMAETSKEEGGDFVRLRCIVGKTLGPEIVVWRTDVRLSDRMLYDKSATVDAVTRPMDALAKVVKEAEQRGYSRGLEKGRTEGKDAALEPFKAIARAFAEVSK